MEYLLDVERFGHGPDLIPAEDWISFAVFGGLTDYDGFGYPVKNGMAASEVVRPSERWTKMPLDATHVLWFNR